MRTPLVGRVGATPFRRHRGEIGRGQERALRRAPAARARVRLLAFRHRPHGGEGATAAAEIVVDRHRSLPDVRLDHLSGDIGISIPPSNCLVGPAAHGMTSKSKMSVGSHKVAQALGMSTTPEMWPWHGAVPRMA